MATAGHPFYVESQGRWVDAGELRAGDVLRAADPHSVVRVHSVRKYNDTARVYNLSISNLHTYYVATSDQQSVLVHNSGVCGEIALGIRKMGLRDFATNRNLTHFLDMGRDEALAAVRNVAFGNPRTPIHVSIDGFTHASDPAKAFESAYTRGGSGDWFTTEREMRILGESVRRGVRDWNTIVFYRGGSVVDIPLPGFLGR